MRSSEFLCGQAEGFGHTLKFAPSRGPAALNPAPEYSHCRPFALSLAPFRPEPACARTDSPSPLPPSLGQRKHATCWRHDSEHTCRIRCCTRAQGSCFALLIVSIHPFLKCL
jgi:hypothetical protein